MCLFRDFSLYSFLKPLPITTVLPPMSWWYSWLRLLFLPYFLVDSFLKESIYIHSLIGTLLAVAGISIISWKGENSLLMLINASIAGTGYGLFSVLVKKFKLNGGLFLTKYLLLFGSVYLAVPFLINLHSITFNSDIILGLIGLAVLPTILGFFCTTKALSYMSAAKVQVTELSEPIFAALMAWVFIHEQPTLSFLYGAIFIISGIFLMNKAPKSN